MAIFRRKKEQLARETWPRLSEEARRPIKTAAHQKAWTDLVAAVGPDAAVEQVEVAAAIGMADAMRAAVEMVLGEFDRGTLSADEAADNIRALGGQFIPKLDDQIAAQQAAATSEDYAQVAVAASLFAETMVKAGVAIVQGSFTPDVEAEWAKLQDVYSATCSLWDRQSNRPMLPLVGNR